MRKTLMPIAIIVIFLIIVAAMIIPSYNTLVDLEENVEQSYAQIQNQLQRRMDLIPNLVNTVKGYAAHEREVIEGIAEARANLAGANTVEEQATADAQLSSALGRLLVVVENYPDLKANQNFRQLMDELAGTENRIAVARQDYNGQVSEFNRRVKRFPGRLIAGIFGFDEKEYFEADAGAQDVPEVDFEGNGA